MGPTQMSGYHILVDCCYLILYLSPAPNSRRALAGLGPGFRWAPGCALSSIQIQQLHFAMSKKFFINNLDTDFGQALLSELVKEPVEDPPHMCTTRLPLATKPNGIKKILKRDKPKLFRKKALDECEVFVYSLTQTEISDIEFGIETMSKPFEDNKVFILVSDIMVWSDSGRKVKVEAKPEAGEGQGEEAEKVEQEPKQEEPEEPKEEASQQEEQAKEQEEEKPIEYTHFEDRDYEERKPLTEYEYIKEIEDRVLAIKKQNVKVFIICPGIIYGCGEDILYPLFKAAWLQNPSALPYIGNGSNSVPMIHMKDLVKFVVKVAESSPEGSPYLLAFDENPDRTQKALIQSISSGVGSGKIESKQHTELIECADRFEFNIDIQPSKFLVGTAEEPSEFEWTSREGIGKNIGKILQEFCTKHSLRPIKLLFIQNEAEWRKDSEIDYIFKMLSEYYRIPVLGIKDIISSAKEGGDPDLIKDIAEEWPAINDYLQSNSPRKLDEAMKVFYRAVRWRLNQNDCFNRGFILENFPQFKEELEHIFMKLSPKKLRRKKKKEEKPKKQVVEKEEGQEQGGEEKEAEANEEEPKAQEEGAEAEEAEEEPAEEGEEGEGPKTEASFPESIISIKQAGKDSNDEVIQFFTARGIEELIYDTTGAHENEIFESIRNYIERNGRPNNYLVDEEELLATHLKFTESQNQKSLNDREAQRKAAEERKKSIADARDKLRDEVVEIVRTEGEEEIKKMPFRNYLMEFVVPTLNEGLLEVSNIIPNDPVDLLAEYLYQKSYDF